MADAKLRKYLDMNVRAVKKELERIGSELTPEQVVTFAKKNDTDLHDCFTWDNHEASRAWRLEEAREVLRSMIREVVIKAPNGSPRAIKARAYEEISLTDSRARAYVPFLVARTSPELI